MQYIFCQYTLLQLKNEPVQQMRKSMYQAQLFGYLWQNLQSIRRMH
ncbi:hypothetical protein [Mucilaginibacter flavus]|nr:hypothetical protein [Mucilaginibacter flavus]MDN3584079.1 hypothetical protein [Mucilaginibacter flavus]